MAAAVRKSQQQAVNRYISGHYDRINLTLQQGGKAEIEAAASARGLSVNSFIREAIAAAVSGGGSTVSAPAGEAAPGPDPLPLDYAAISEHVERIRTGETVAEFVARAVNDTIGRDRQLVSMGMSPVASPKA